MLEFVSLMVITPQEIVMILNVYFEAITPEGMHKVGGKLFPDSIKGIGFIVHLARILRIFYKITHQQD